MGFEFLLTAGATDEALRLVAQDLLAGPEPVAALKVARLKQVAAQVGLASASTVVKLRSNNRPPGTGAT